ncbi:MAG: cation transporter [Candidatus Liberibacter europaeus]|uniref:Cation transporter n=1 Tax=Candidatus Liberibacter europaeus TaxID=744859 RepID=A0A2T4VXU5_9HYPH|nr:cation transporter [Candidatus Liberibacter europaeus]PTL86590.1 MAG: cation transporter [Candidatus Liberibacter europaeus]
MKQHYNKIIAKMALWGVFISIFITLLKVAAWYVTGFVSLLSDGLESTVNIVTAIISYFTIKYACRPADHNHPFGHQKAEYIAAVIEGILMVCIALVVLYKSWQNYTQITYSNNISIIGFLISLISSIISLIWGMLMIKYGEKYHSAALKANGQHLISDVLMSIGVISGLLLTVITKYNALDSIIATFMSIAILYNGWQIIASSISGLMDGAVQSKYLEKIKSIIALNASGSKEIHDLKVRQSGSVFFINFHLVVDSKMTVLNAHKICNNLEKSIEKVIPETIITIHVEPETERSHGIKIKL